MSKPTEEEAAAQELALAVLRMYAGPYYVAKDDTQRRRVLEEAGKTLAPVIVKIREGCKTAK